MDTTQNKPVDKTSPPAPLKKSLALATVAASLGIALGVNVADVLAAEKQLSSPPNALSRQDKDMAIKQHKEQLQQSKQIKDTANQSKQIKGEINQSKQIKHEQMPQNLYGK